MQASFSRIPYESIWSLDAPLYLLRTQLVRLFDGKVVAQGLTNSKVVRNQYMLGLAQSGKAKVFTHIHVWDIVNKGLASSNPKVKTLFLENKIHKSMELAQKEGAIEAGSPYRAELYCDFR